MGSPKSTISTGACPSPQINTFNHLSVDGKVAAAVRRSLTASPDSPATMTRKYLSALDDDDDDDDDDDCNWMRKSWGSAVRAKSSPLARSSTKPLRADTEPSGRTLSFRRLFQPAVSPGGKKTLVNNSALRRVDFDHANGDHEDLNESSLTLVSDFDESMKPMKPMIRVR